MSTLAEFLLARIAEDEVVAADVLKDAREHGEVPDPDGPEPYSSYMPHMTGLGVYANNADSSGNNIVALEPERAVAEFAAKRRIVDLHEVDLNFPDQTVCHTCDDGDLVKWPCLTVRLLALPYAAHPDYRAEWKP